MPTLTQKSQEERPVYCRDCYIPMHDVKRGQESYRWICEKCGREWKPDKSQLTQCRCGSDEICLKIKEYFVKETRHQHIGIYCRGCDKWFKWIEQ